MRHRETPTSWFPGDIWSKGVSLILACDHNFLKVFLLLLDFVDFLRLKFLLGFLYQPSVDQPTVNQPTVDNGGVSRAGEGLWLWLLVFVTGDR